LNENSDLNPFAKGEGAFYLKIAKISIALMRRHFAGADR